MGLFADGPVARTASQCWPPRGVDSPQAALQQPSAYESQLVARLERARQRAPEDCNLALYVHEDVSVERLARALAVLRGRASRLHLGFRFDWPACSEPEATDRTTDGLEGPEGG